MIGLAQGALDATMPYLIQRSQFGSPIADFQGMQFTYADAATGNIHKTGMKIHSHALHDNFPIFSRAINCCSITTSTDILAGRLLCLNAARMKEAGIPFVLEV